MLITYSVTTNLVNAGDASLVNKVSSTLVGSTCSVGSDSGPCVSTVAVESRVLSVSDMTSAFTLTGLPNSTAEQEGAVGMTVTTNSSAGYSVTVQSTGDVLTPSAPGNSDTVDVGRLAVRDSGQTVYTPLSENPYTVHTKTGPSAPGGDAVSNDYQVDIPFVASDTYSTELDYIVTAQ